MPKIGISTRIISGHAPGHLRDEFSDVIDLINDNPKLCRSEWLKSMKNEERARRIFGRMWNCTDIAPNDLRQVIADYVAYATWSTKKENAIRGGCTYATIARLMVVDLIDFLKQ